MNRKMTTTVFSKRMNKINLSFLLFLTVTGYFVNPAMGQLQGAWASTDGIESRTIIFTATNFSCAVYQVNNKKFVGTYGGSYRVEGTSILETQEFNTFNSSLIAVVSKSEFHLNGDKLIISNNGKEISFSRVDSGMPGKLAGAWLITGRMVDGKVSSITPGARRTMKILSGTRFQWIAYNIETKEFFGTGGGVYETTENQYTEKIDFFSRDGNRVGATLAFDFSIESGRWHHSGLSSKGDPINEYWSLRETIGF